MSSHSLLRESVALTLIQGSEIIDRSAIIQCLSQLIQLDDIDSLGNLGDMNEWFVICKSTQARDQLLNSTELKVNDQIFSIGEPYKNIKLIRLTNIPPTVPDDDVRSIVTKWGVNILNIVNETMPHPHEGIKTFVRRVQVRLAEKQDELKIPISVKHKGLNILVHLEGRKKVCFRCKKSGHVKADCPIPVCQKCKGVGHDDPGCRLRHSYATAVLSTASNIINSTLSTNDTVKEKPVPSGNKSVRTGAQQASEVAIPVKPKLCHHCKVPGHLRKHCPQWAKKLNEPDKTMETSEEKPPEIISDETSERIEDEQISTPDSADEFHAEDDLTDESRAEDDRGTEVHADKGRSLSFVIEEGNINSISSIKTVVVQDEITKLTDTGNIIELENEHKSSKRGLADRSLDSEPELFIKKINKNDSTSLKHDSLEDGQIENQNS